MKGLSFMPLGESIGIILFSNKFATFLDHFQNVALFHWVCLYMPEKEKPLGG
jgi:hypothetical protein